MSSVRRCDHCGAEEGGATKVRQCKGCKSAMYCSTECQKQAWKTHRSDCKKIQAQRRAAEPPSHVDIDSARVALACLLATHEGDHPTLGPAISDAKKFQIINKFADEDMTVLRAGLAYDPESFVHQEESDSAHIAAPFDLFGTLAELSRRDAARLREIAATRDPNLVPSLFPSHHLYLAVVRWRPSEPDFRPGPDRSAMRACPSRSAAFLGRSFPEHLALCAVAWDAARPAAAVHPALYQMCKDLWRMLPISLCIREVAEAVLRSHGPFTAEGLRDLTRMLDLRGEANDLEGLTNQVAAVLFCQARRINRKGEREGRVTQQVQSADELEGIFASNFDEAQFSQWKGMSIPVADEMCRLERGLSGAEFGAILRTVGLP